MNEIKKHLTSYYDAQLVRHNPTVLFKRLNIAFKKVRVTDSQIQSLQRSIQYPYINGEFVVLLDNCTIHEFETFLKTSHVPSRMKPCISAFYKKIKQPSNSQTIDINSFKFPVFSHKKLSTQHSITPKLTSSLYKRKT